MKATIRLFKALLIKSKEEKLPSLRLLKSTIKKGFVFSPEVLANYSNYSELMDLVEEVYGMTPEKLNASFHKSWAKVKDASIAQLVIEQWAHYLTTYGKEDPLAYAIEKGIRYLPGEFNVSKMYDKDYVYIPKEVLNIPDLEMDSIKLVVIKGYTEQELKKKLLKLLDSGIALKEDTIKDIVDVALSIDIDDKEIENIKNKEARVILYDYLGITPSNPTEFLRSIIYQTTNETLLIKSKELIQKIKEGTGFKIIRYFEAYNELYGLNGYKRLAEIFYRFKPIFLAFRANQKLKYIINQIRRLAKDYHKPMPEDYLNTVTAKLKRQEIQDTGRLERELDKVNIFRKIRLAYALKYRTKEVYSILYRIRNGKAYAKDFYFGKRASAKIILDIVLDSIAKDVKKNVKGKKIYIPDYINYSLPATEKQFTGNFPSGTYISIPNDMIFGIHWENVKDYRIDLDLSLISSSTGKIGWDGSYRTDERDILFSGDITNAPKPLGATELFYVKRQIENNCILLLNYYNYNDEVKVPFKIIIAKEEAKNFESNYIVNPNNIVTTVQSEIDEKQKILGLLTTTVNGSKFYFVETAIGKSITSSNTDFVNHSKNYLADFYQNSIELKDILVRAGAEIWDEPSSLIDIDLSPESLEKGSILNLLI